MKYNFLAGQFWPAVCMFDTPGLKPPDWISSRNVWIP